MPVAPRIVPRALSPGACVGVIAPGGVVHRPEVEAGIASLESAGFRVRPGRALWKHHGYLAGTDRERAQDLIEMFLDHEVQAVFAARGGYGCTRLLPLLDPAMFRTQNKIFVGSSDCTALLEFLVDRCGIVAFHGPVVSSFAGRPGALDGLLSVLAGTGPRLVCAPRCLRPGRGEGILRGGCLSILQALLGTPFSPTSEPTVWFFEDIDEKPYRIDRMLTQWGQAGLWQTARGTVWGEMVSCEARGSGWDVWQVILEHTGALRIPVAAGLPSGHGASTVTLPFGVRVRLVDAALEFLEPWVSP